MKSRSFYAFNSQYLLWSRSIQFNFLNANYKLQWRKSCPANENLSNPIGDFQISVGARGRTNFFKFLTDKSPTRMQARSLTASSKTKVSVFGCILFSISNRWISFLQLTSCCSKSGSTSFWSDFNHEEGNLFPKYSQILGWVRSLMMAWKFCDKILLPIVKSHHFRTIPQSKNQKRKSYFLHK